jgi:hypothetical protein
MDKSIVIITAHCDSEEKINMLVDCINEIKSQGYSIIISSHIKVPDFISDLVDYTIYDKENPIIYNYEFEEYGSTTTWLWTSYYGFYQEYTFDFNHAYAVLKLIKNGVAIAKINGYEISHVVCYDYVIKDKNLLKTHSEYLKEYDVYSYNIKNGAKEDIISVGLFSFRNDKFIESFSDINSKKDYSNCTYAILEEFLSKTFEKKSAKVFKRDINEIIDDNVLDRVTNFGNINKNVIKNENNENISLLFLTNVNNDYYIYFIPFIELTLNIKIKEFTYQLKSTTHKSNLIPVTIEQLKEGIKIEIPELKIEDFYTLNSRFSTGKIENDNNLFVKLEDIKSH